MKKTICLILISAMLFSLISCGKTYDPIESTEQESQIVMTIEYEKQKYDVKYELYRALFLNFKNMIDGGDDTVWSGDDKEKYIEKIDALIEERIAEIYSAFYLADKIGFDVYSNKCEKEIKKYIKTSVEGGTINSSTFVGFDGDYGKYLESLKKANLNYSVQVLLIRYSLAVTAINEYYAGKSDESGEISFEKPDLNPKGELKYTEDDIKKFYESDDCVRVLHLFLPETYYSEKRANEIRDDITYLSGEEAVGNKMMTFITGDPYLKNGILIAKYSTNKNYYGNITDAALSLNLYETSEVIKVSAEAESGYSILYRTDKNDEYFEELYHEVVNTYIQNEIGKIFDTAMGEIKNSIERSAYFEELDRSSISMP